MVLYELLSIHFFRKQTNVLRSVSLPRLLQCQVPTAVLAVAAVVVDCCIGRTSSPWPPSSPWLMTRGTARRSIMSTRDSNVRLTSRMTQDAAWAEQRRVNAGEVQLRGVI